MESFINTVNGIVWSPALVYLCLGAGLFLSLRGGFLQLRHLKHMWQLLFQPKDNVTGVSSFQALSMTLAGRVGTGNIAGVATAITFGGPGAIFWMWMVAFLGASSAFVESTLGQVYKKKSTANTAAALLSTLNAAWVSNGSPGSLPSSPSSPAVFSFPVCRQTPLPPLWKTPSASLQQFPPASSLLCSPSLCSAA